MSATSNPYRLYNYFRSSTSYRVRIALNLKGLAYEYIPVHIAKGEHKQAAYAGQAPMEMVPALELPDGTLLTQSLAIMEWLDERHPTPALLPQDSKLRAQVRALALLVACEIHPLNNLRVLQYLSTHLHVDEQTKNTWYRHWARQGLELLERQLQAWPMGKFCVGDTPSMADCCLVPQVFNAQRFDTPLDDLHRVMAVWRACEALPAFAAAHPSRCPDAA